MPPTTLIKLLAHSPPNPYSPSPHGHRTVRLRLLQFLPYTSLQALRLVSRLFHSWLKYSEPRIFSRLELKLNLTADCYPVIAEKLAALSRISAHATRLTITLLVPSRRQHQAPYRPRKSSRKDTSDAAPHLPEIFNQLSSGLFTAILTCTPKITCLFIRDRTAPSHSEDEWDLTLTDRALALLRSQLEDLHTAHIMGPPTHPPVLFSLQLELRTPLALRHFRAHPRADGSICGWASTITCLSLALPSPTPGATREQRSLIKRSYVDLLAEFAPSCESLAIKFLASHRRAEARGPPFSGERRSMECPLVYGCGDLEFLSAEGEGEVEWPVLRRLGLINTTVRWEGGGGLREFFGVRAQRCITVHFTEVVFGGAERVSGWEGLYTVFMLDNPGRRGRFGWAMTRKFE